MNILDILYFLPTVVAVLWTLSFILSKRNYRQNVYLVILISFIFYFFSLGLYMFPTNDVEMIVKIEPYTMVLGLISSVTMILYLLIHITHRKLKIAYSLLYVPTIIFATLHTTLYYLIGCDGAIAFFDSFTQHMAFPPEYDNRLYHSYFFVNMYLSTIIAGVTMIGILSLCLYLTFKEGYKFGDLYRFIFKGQKSTPSRMISLCCMIISICIIICCCYYFSFQNETNASINILMLCIIAVALHFQSFAEYNSHIEIFDKKNVTEALLNRRTDKKDDMKDLSVDDNEADELLDNKGGAESLSDFRRSIRTTDLASELMRLLEEEKVYLDTDISIIEVAKRLNVGRSTLSSMVNTEFGKNFRAVINDYRIEYAKKYMRENPTDTQEMVAYKCGFKDASAFSHKFKDIVGTTPSLWLMSGK